MAISKLRSFNVPLEERFQSPSPDTPNLRWNDVSSDRQINKLSRALHLVKFPSDTKQATHLLKPPL